MGCRDTDDDRITAIPTHKYSYPPQAQASVLAGLLEAGPAAETTDPTTANRATAAVVMQVNRVESALVRSTTDRPLPSRPLPGCANPQNPPTHTNQPHPTTQAALDELTQLTLDRMMGHVPLPAIVRKITSPLPTTFTSTPQQPPTPSTRLLQQLGTAPSSTAATTTAPDAAADGTAAAATVGELRDLLLAMFETYHHERAIYAAGASLMGESHYRLLKARRAAQGRGRAVRVVDGGGGGVLPLRLPGVGVVGDVGEGGKGPGGQQQVWWVDEGGRAGLGRGRR